MIAEKNIELKNKTISAYYDELKEDTTLSILNLREKSMLVSSIRTKWIMYLFKERENLNRVKARKKELLTLKLKESNSSTSSSMLKLKNQDALIENNKDIQKLNSLINYCQEVINFLEYVINVLNDFGFTIKNSIDLLKLEQI